MGGGKAVIWKQTGLAREAEVKAKVRDVTAGEFRALWVIGRRLALTPRETGRGRRALI